MSSTRWTRKRWYRAKHLSRLLFRLDLHYNVPPAVEEFRRLVDGLELWRPDPLSIHISFRRPMADGEPPF